MKYLLLFLVSSIAATVFNEASLYKEELPLIHYSAASNSTTYAPTIPDKCTKETHAINNVHDLNHLDDCEVISGNVLIHNFKESIIQLSPKIQEISGSLGIRNAPNLVRIEAPGLNSIGSTFSLRELTSLALLSFPSLKSVKALDWRVLPILSTVHFNNEIKGIESITISDTSLTAFSGFLTNNLTVLDLNNNRFLESISSNVEKVTEKLHIAANADNVIVNLSHLKYAKNLTIQETSKLDLTNLELIENSASFINNKFKQLKLPKLKSIGGTVSISKNPQLSVVEFPVADEIGGGLVIVNNTSIDKINFLPSISVIGGALELIGNIKEIQLKHLKLVKGSAKIKSFSSTFDCSKWSKSEIGSVIRGGRIECTNGNDENYVSEEEHGSNDGYYHEEGEPAYPKNVTLKSSSANCGVVSISRIFVIIFIAMLLNQF